MKIAPSILDANFQTLQSEIDSIQSSDRVHLDIMDGHYVPNLSFGPPVLKGIKWGIETEAHLMVDNPEDFWELYADLGCKTLTFHIENTGRERAMKLVKLIQSRGLKAGIALDGYTSVDFLDEALLQTVDQVLLMSVKAGFGGQAFMTEVLEKIQTLRKRGYTNEIEIDGGVSDQNIKSLQEAGADICVVGSFLMKKEVALRPGIIKTLQGALSFD